MKTTETEGLSSLVVKTPVGKIWIVAREGKIAAAELEPRWEDLKAWLKKRYGVDLIPRKSRTQDRSLQRAERALERYFKGDLDAPSQIEVLMDGSTLQRKIWQTVRSISPGQTITYGELAAKARKPGAFRAAGAANGANRCAIFIPCHRVVAGSGALQGYGGGIEAKSWLLDHEGVTNNGTRLAGEGKAKF
jgi:methylated-DNA-[protein]-cysteine S-methyltransferase